MEPFLNKGIALHPKSAALYLVRAQYDLQRQEPEKALAAFRTALDVDPESIAGCRGMTKVLDSLGRPAESAPWHARLFYLTGRQLEDAGQWDRALLEYGRAADLMKQNSRYVAAQGLVLMKKHLNDQAEKKLNRALQLDSLETQALYGLGVTAGDRGEYMRAIRYLQKAIQQDSSFGQAHYSLAVNYYFNRQIEKARYHLLRAQTLGVPIRKELLDAMEMK